MTNFNTTLLSWESETTIFVIFVIPVLKSVFKEEQTDVTSVVMSIMHECSRVLVRAATVMYCNEWGELYVHAQLYVVLHVHATTSLKK